MSSQLQENFPLRRAADSFEISFTKWLRGTKTVQLPVTFSMKFQTVLIDMFSELEEHFISNYKINRTLHDRFGDTNFIFSWWKYLSFVREWQILSASKRYLQHEKIKFVLHATMLYPLYLHPCSITWARCAMIFLENVSWHLT